MDYYAGLDVSMEEPHLCLVERDGGVVLEAKARSTPEAIASRAGDGTCLPQDRARDRPMAPML